MRPRVLYSAKDFVSRLKHVPASVGKEFDGVVLIQFKKFHDWDPYLEFGVDINPDKGGQYFFYEQCNFGTLESGDEYVPGTFLPLSDKNRRRDQIYTYLCRSNFDTLVDHVNASLDRLYSSSHKN